MAGRMFRDLGRDLRHAARLLAREPGYTAVALLGIALGIGATTTLFSVAYGVLLKPLPWPEPDRLVRLVPGSGHLTHMPSHIYVRIGRYTDAADANERAIAADQSYLADAPEQDYYGMYIAHNLHFLAYAAMMEGRYETALGAARGLDTQVPETFMARYPGIADGWAAAEPHVLVRFGKWQDILAMPDYPEARHISRARTATAPR